MDNNHNDKSGTGLVIGAVLLGVGLSLFGGWLILQSSYFFGVIVLMIGAGILTFLTSSILPNIKDEYRFAGICVIAVVASLLIFGLDMSSSGGTSWGDLSDTEKANAKWSYDAKNYIDSYD